MTRVQGTLRGSQRVSWCVHCSQIPIMRTFSWWGLSAVLPPYLSVKVVGRSHVLILLFRIFWDLFQNFIVLQPRQFLKMNNFIYNYISISCFYNQYLILLVHMWILTIFPPLVARQIGRGVFFLFKHSELPAR